MRRKGDVYAKGAISAIARAAFLKGYYAGRADGYLLRVGQYVVNVGFVSIGESESSVRFKEFVNARDGFPPQNVTAVSSKSTTSTKPARTLSRRSGNGFIRKLNS